MLVLKNNKGIEENRVRHLDYGVQFNRLMYERLLENKNITLFSPSDVPGLYESFFIDYYEFKKLYEAAESDVSLRKKVIPALELFSSFLQERKDTGRVYLMNVDHCNDHGPFIKETAPIRMSNLCCEVTLRTQPLKNLSDPDAEIALCTLSAINWGRVHSPNDFERICTLAVRGLDELLSYQEYPVIAAFNSTIARRPLGVGIINLAYWLARHGIPYDNINSDGLMKIHEYAEAWSYYLIKASADLAIEKGACPKSNETKYSMGILPIDTYKKAVDELTMPTYKMPWDQLRQQLRDHGIRNSTLMALMPAETSAQLSNSTNGIEPVRSLVTTKVSKDGVLKQVVPSIHRLKNKYNLLWDQKSPEGYLKICAVLQKFIDQSISTNTSYNPKHHPDEQIPLSVLIRDVINCYKWGIKTLYYFNVNDGAGEQEMPELTYTDVVEHQCDSCTI